MHDDATRFWARVQKTDACWPWIGGKTKAGYGLFGPGNTKRLAHRIAWELTHGPIPVGLFVCHTCDNPPCVRPDHLFLGTAGDNADDKHAKGRGRGRPKGSPSPARKLTAAQVIEIRDRYTGAWGEQSRLARAYGVTQGAIWRIVRRVNWANVH
jgi:hypothetical protein